MNNKFLINSYSLLKAHITSPLAVTKRIESPKLEGLKLGHLQCLSYKSQVITNNFVTNKNSKLEYQNIKISLNLRNY